MTALGPGSTLGILGGGQLGRMLAIAAYRLGLKVHVFAEDAAEPALDVTGSATVAAFDDTRALDAFAAAVDVVTLEFENVPTATVERLARRVPVRPGAGVLAVTQDRLHEKELARRLGLETAPFAAFDGENADEIARTLTFPVRLKTRRLGYDGKGQVRVTDPASLRAAWQAVGRVPAVVEAEVAFERELSVLVARRPAGDVVCFPLAENRHEDGVLRETTAPAAAAPSTVRRAEDMALRLARALDLEGLLAVELFETDTGALLVNELAPRPHNSGHWTLEGCLPDQFEQAVRAACDLPLGTPEVLGRCRMVNLLGADVTGADRWLAERSTRLHLYGKAAHRPGRKMGHITQVEPGA